MRIRIKQKILSGILLSMGVFFLIGMQGNASSLQSNPYITFSTDGKAFTTNAGDTNTKWYFSAVDQEVSTGIASTLRETQIGEHSYQYNRTGIVPIGSWKVALKAAICCHNHYPAEDDPYYGITYRREPCFTPYYSGWFGYCADCGESVTKMLVYMSKEAAVTIKDLDMSLEYYYTCPTCTNLEQGAKLNYHTCTTYSWNKYRIIYEINTAPQGSGGYMEKSYHMYNNATEYEGRVVTPQTKLSINTYFRMGYVFAGWNTKADGSGTAYKDQQTILNLTTENFNEELGTGTITLYAQWKLSSSTLQIDANEGTYNKVGGVSSLVGKYLETYSIDMAKLIPPSGYTVSFEANGGNQVSPIVGTRSFIEWRLSQPFVGQIKNNIYRYGAQDGITDRLTAIYQEDGILLPGAVREGWSFGGWYYNSECSEYAGKEGERLIPNQNITIYAKWVELILKAENNNTEYSGSGAVDLTWNQPDGKNKTYLLYQSLDKTTWSKIKNATDISTTLEVSESFVYSGSQKTYTVPYTGLYTLTLNGAQAGSYGSYTGGKGGNVVGDVWLLEGEKLTYTIGGSNGYHGGGSATTYGKGGGYTTISSNLKGTLMIAGGGGGATLLGNGGSGGSSASLRTDNVSTGASGHAGGGGGSVGGNAGELNIHYCNASCYKTVSLDYNYFSLSNRNADISLSGDFYADQDREYGKYFHSKGYAYATVIPKLNNSQYIPTNGNTMVSLSVLSYCWGDKHNGYTSVTILDQNNNTLLTARSDNVADDITQTIGYVKYVNEYNYIGGSVSSFRKNMYVNLPLSTSTTAIKVIVQLNALNSSSWDEVSLSSLSFSGTKQEKICGYTNGQVLSSKPAYGGSNYVNTTYVKNYTSKAGMQSSNGSLQIQSIAVGFMESLAQNAVQASDKEAPDRIYLADISKTALEENQIAISWEQPQDNGTLYYHKAESYLIGESHFLCTSNITENILKSGIQGYYYLINTSPSTAVTKSNGTFTANTTKEVTLTEDIQYFHVAAVDVAGNLSATTHLQIGKTDVEVAWNLETAPIGIALEEGIYPTEEDNIYYVRSDDTFEFTLEYDAKVLGLANARYQINYSIFEIQEILSSSMAQFSIETPSHPITAEAVLTTNSDLTKRMTGESYLRSGSIAETIRKEKGTILSTKQSFRLKQSADNKMIKIMPIAGADFGEDIVYSDTTKDTLNSIYLIGDNTAPYIDVGNLFELEIVDNEVTQEVTLSAEDNGSGLKEFYAVLTNRNNYVTETLNSDETGTILLQICEASTLWNGDVIVELHSIDNVGNERIVTHDFTGVTLQTYIERIREPHDPVFQRGESGYLNITTIGYADTIEIIFPEKLYDDESSRKITYTYEYPIFMQAEKLQFMIPLYAPEKEYEITVIAYKNGIELKSKENLSVVSGTILDDFRTRLR